MLPGGRLLPATGFVVATSLEIGLRRSCGQRHYSAYRDCDDCGAVCVPVLAGEAVMDHRIGLAAVSRSYLSSHLMLGVAK